MAVTINRRLTHCLNYTFTNVYGKGMINYSLPGVNWSKNNVFTRFIKCDLKRPEFEVPILLQNHVDAKLKQLNSDIENIEYVAPIIQHQSRTATRRTADSIINLLFDHSIQHGMINIETNKGVKYYGGKGYIFDDNFDLLFFTTLVCKLNSSLSLSTEIYTCTECRVYIHPKVLINSDDLLHKCLMKKVVPYLLSSRDVLLQLNQQIAQVPDDVKVKVIIEDASRFFVTPSHEEKALSNEDLNDTLVNNISDILDNF